jgi:hypothetical protein
VQYKAAPFATAVRSAVINTAGFALRGFYVPTGFLGTALTFLASPTEVSVNTDAKLLPVVDEAGTTLSVTVAAGRYVVLGKEFSEKLNALGNSIVIVSNASETVALTLVTVASGK